MGRPLTHLVAALVTFDQGPATIALLPLVLLAKLERPGRRVLGALAWSVVRCQALGARFSGTGGTRRLGADDHGRQDGLGARRDMAKGAAGGRVVFGEYVALLWRHEFTDGPAW